MLSSSLSTGLLPPWLKFIPKYFIFLVAVVNCWVFSSIFNVKMAEQKFTNFDFFLMYADMTASTIQSNTESFQMKLKTNEHYSSYRTEKN